MFLTGQSDDAEERANRVAAAILNTSIEEQPDVIAFNEVFDEDGRKKLIERLGNIWPNYVEKIDHPLDLEDSGLLLMSKLPFKRLPNGEYVGRASTKMTKATTARRRKPSALCRSCRQAT